jgi:hypothetical protein
MGWEEREQQRRIDNHNRRANPRGRFGILPAPENPDRQRVASHQTPPQEPVSPKPVDSVPVSPTQAEETTSSSKIPVPSSEMKQDTVGTTLDEATPSTPKSRRKLKDVILTPEEIERERELRLDKMVKITHKPGVPQRPGSNRGFLFDKEVKEINSERRKHGNEAR